VAVNNVLAKRRANVNWQNPYRNHPNYGLTALHLASLYNEDEIVSALLKAGADKDKKDVYGRTAMHFASDVGNTDVITTLTLYEYGADVNVQEDNGWTPLFRATLFGYVSIVEELINAQANVSYSDYHQQTALHFAANSNRPEIAQILLEKGADPKKQDKYGKFPAGIARENGFYQLAKTIESFYPITQPTTTTTVQPWIPPPPPSLALPIIAIICGVIVFIELIVICVLRCYMTLLLRHSRRLQNQPPQRGMHIQLREVVHFSNDASGPAVRIYDVTH
ncbi:unnamed protein product, partial [Meganyctiphanes norvegica]